MGAYNARYAWPLKEEEQNELGEKQVVRMRTVLVYQKQLCVRVAALA